MLTCGIPQAYYLGVFAVAFGAAGACTHGDLLLRNCHSLIVVYWFSRRRIAGGRRWLSLVPFPFIFNSSRWLAGLSLGMTGSNPPDPVQGKSSDFQLFSSLRSRRAASRQLISASPVKGLVRKQLAPAFSACARASSVAKAVMKMNGAGYPLASR